MNDPPVYSLDTTFFLTLLCMPCWLISITVHDSNKKFLVTALRQSCFESYHSSSLIVMYQITSLQIEAARWQCVLHPAKYPIIRTRWRLNLSFRSPFLQSKRRSDGTHESDVRPPTVNKSFVPHTSDQSKEDLIYCMFSTIRLQVVLFEPSLRRSYRIAPYTPFSIHFLAKNI